MSIDINHVAELAKLSLREEDVPMLEKQIQDIISKIGDLPDGLEDSFELKREDQMQLRPDNPEKSLSRDEFLAKKKKKQAGCIVVPKIV